MSKLGALSLEVFPIVLGTNTFGWTTDEAASHAVLDGFVAGGGTLVDTADSYPPGGAKAGLSETILGSWLAQGNHRDQVLVATKISRKPDRRGLAPDNVQQATDEALGRLGIDTIDLLWAHYDDPDVPLADTLGAFQKLVDDGKVRELGISNYEPARITEWVTTAQANGFRQPAALQPQYSLLRRHEYEDERQKLALDHDLAVFPYWVLASGLLTGKYRSAADLGDQARRRIVESYADDAAFGVVDALVEIGESHSVAPSAVALAWTLTRPGIAGPIASASSVEQLPGLLDAASLQLSDDEVSRLTALSDAVGQ